MKEAMYKIGKEGEKTISEIQARLKLKSKSDVLRRALALLAILSKVVSRGGIIITRENGEETEIQID